MDIPVVGPSSQGVSPVLNAERTVNLYVEADPRGKRPTALVNGPGKELVAAPSLFPVRGAIAWKGSSLWVMGDHLFERDAMGAVLDRGQLVGTVVANRVSMENNFTQVLIVDGVGGTPGNGWIWDGATITKISDPDFPGGTRAAYLDGRFLVNVPSSGLVAQSDPLDGLNWDPNRKNAEAKDDLVLGVVADEEFVYVFGERTTEVWWNQGLVPFPYQRIANGVLSWGIHAPHSAAIGDNRVVWLARKPEGGAFIVQGAAAAAPQVISTPQMGAIFDTYPTLEDGFAHVYAEAGHLFYQLTFPQANATWVYDFLTGLWTERERFSLGRDGASGFAVQGTWNLVGDAQRGSIYRQHIGYYRDDGETVAKVLRKRRITPILHAGAQDAVVTYHRLRLMIETGIGNADVADPQVGLEWSDTHGRTWSNLVLRSLGKVGQYNREVLWTRLGQAKDRIYQFTITDPVKVRITGADVVASVSDPGRSAGRLGTGSAP